MPLLCLKNPVKNTGRDAFRVKRPMVSKETMPKHIKACFCRKIELFSNVINVEFQPFRETCG